MAIRSAQDIVSDIRSMLNRTQWSDNDAQQLADVAREYSVAVRDVLRRAKQCRTLLESGQKDQAISITKQGSDLRKQFEALDFAELGQWLDLVEQFSLETPPLMDQSVEALIMEIYSTKGSLDGLIHAYRELSLGRAPLSDRLRVLRSIAKADPASSEWQADIALFEKAHLSELTLLVRDAIREGDFKTLQRGISALQSDEWKSVSTKRLLVEVQQASESLRQQWATKQYALLAESIRDAHSAQDEASCRDGLKQCNGIEAVSQYASAGENAATFESARLWLSELERLREEDEMFSRACLELEQAIDDEVKAETLDTLFLHVERFDRPMPEALSSRYTARCEELRLRRKRVFVLRMVGIAAAAILVLSLTAVYMHTQKKTQQRQTWERQITTKLEAADLAGVGLLVEQVQNSAPDIHQTAEIQELIRRYEKAVKSEAIRLERFKDIYTRIAADEYHQNSRRSMSLLQDAESLARTPEEQLRIQKIKQLIDKIDHGRKQKAEEAYLAQVHQLQQSVQAVESAYGEKLEEFPDLASACLEMARPLRDQHGIDASLKAPVLASMKRLKSMRTQWDLSINQRRARRLALDTIGKRWANPDEIKRLADAFCEQYPSDPISRDLKIAMKTWEFRDQQAEWKALISAWRSLDVLTQTEAKNRKKALQAFVEMYPDGNTKSFAARYLNYLNAANVGLDAHGITNTAIVSQLLQSPVLSSLNSLSLPDGRVFYLKEEESLGPPPMLGDRVTAIKFNYVYDDSFDTRKIRIKPNRQIKNLSKLKITPAPQIAFLKAANALFGKGKASGINWPVLHLQLAALTQKQTEMDPVLRGLIIRILLKHAKDVSVTHQDGLTALYGELEKIDMNVAWMDPQDASANQARKTVRAILKSFPSLEKVTSDVQKNLDSLRDDCLVYDAAGIVWGPDGTVVLKSSMTDTPPLFTPKVTPQRTTILSVPLSPTTGKYDVGSLPQGTLLYVRRSQFSKKP